MLPLVGLAMRFGPHAWWGTKGTDAFAGKIRVTLRRLKLACRYSQQLRSPFNSHSRADDEGRLVVMLPPLEISCAEIVHVYQYAQV